MSRAFLAVCVIAVAATPGYTAEKTGESLKKPQLDVRASPRFAFSPATILLTAELKGGDDHPAFYCPEVEWDWDDGGRSVREADCAPQEEGGAMARRFSANHSFRHAGTYNVRVTLRRNDRSIAATSVSIVVRPGVGDMTGLD